MYWWSNIAVPEAEDVRVIAPAENAFHFDLDRHGLVLVPTPIYQNIDYTYSTRTKHASDYFFNIPEGKRPYIAALDADGVGLVQTSTARLRGRKLFFWGSGSGGKRWQEFLSPLGGRYMEIQAGLAQTQLEHLPMPAYTRWSWMEAYGMLKTDPKHIHGSDWQVAQSEVETSLHELIPYSVLESMYLRGIEIELSPLNEIWIMGSGWGYIEETRRRLAREAPLGGSHLVFDRQSVTASQLPWLELLESVRMKAEPDVVPASFQVSNEWKEILQKATTGSGKGDWLIWYHAGIAYYYNQEISKAIEAWMRSLATKPTPWVYRCLAYVAWKNGDFPQASSFYDQAYLLLPGNIPLTIEYGKFLLEFKREDILLRIIETSPKPVQQNGRIRLLQAKAALKLNRFDLVESFFTDQIEVADLREGEDALSELWFDFQEKRYEAINPGVKLSKNEILELFPLPASFDFRMQIG